MIVCCPAYTTIPLLLLDCLFPCSRSQRSRASSLSYAATAVLRCSRCRHASRFSRLAMQFLVHKPIINSYISNTSVK
jgi:hypothetical protein